MKEYDVHFSLNGFYMISAEDPEGAMQKAEEILLNKIPELEEIVMTGLGVEVYDALTLKTWRKIDG